MSKEAMKLALEALEVATTPFARDRQEVLRAQAALREALEQHENRWAEFNETTKRNIEHAEWYLSTHPEPAQDEPATVVGAIPMGHNQKDMPFAHVDHLPVGTKLYTRPQAREPLTDEQIERIWESLPFCNGAWEIFARAIEAAHGIKENT